MRRDRDNRDHVFAGAVVPEDAVGSGCVVFGVGFEYVFTIGSAFGTKLVCFQSLMSRIGLQLS
jgi:hypothetical protein